MTIEFEDILKTVGDFGRYQKILICSFLVPVSALTPLFFLGVIFMASTPDHWCYVPEVAMSNLSSDDQLSLIRPEDNPSCTTYDVDYAEVMKSGNLTANKDWPRRSCLNGYQYDKTNYDATAVTRWNMVCNDSHYSSLVLSLVFAGDVIGTPLFGHLSDRFGRKPIFFFLSGVTALTEIGSVLMPNFVVFLVLRAINGSVVTVLYISSYVTLLELVATGMRTRINGIATASWSIGLCLLPLIAWQTRHWIGLSIFCSASAFSFLLYWKLFPESPRWLISEGRYEDAFKVLASISRKNGLKSHESDELMKQIQRFGDRMKKEKEDKNKNSPLDIIRYPQLRKRFVLVTLCWIGNSLPYFGLLVNVKNLWGNEFLNFFLMSLLEFPSHAVTWFCMEKIGRRWTSVGALSITTIACLMPSLLPKDLAVVGVVCSLFGKLGSSSAYMTLYQQGPEIYPTPVRSLGMSLSSTIGSATSLSVPFIADLAVYGKHFPFLVFSAVSFCAALSASFLPETLNKTLPQTLEDAELFAKDDKFFACYRKSSKASVDSQFTRNIALTKSSISTIFKGFHEQAGATPNGLSFKVLPDDKFLEDALTTRGK